MSTVSNCTRTSADSSLGLDQICKEIFLDLKNDVSHPQQTSNWDEDQDSCDGKISSGSQYLPDISKLYT